MLNLTELSWISGAGSQHFLEPKSLMWLFVPPAFLTSLATSGAVDIESTAAWVLGNIVSFALLVMIAVAFRALRAGFYRRELIGLPVVLLISFSLGVFTSFSAGFVSSLLLGDSDAPSHSLNRSLASGLVAMIAFAGIAAFVSVIGEVRKDNDQIFARRMSHHLRSRALLDDNQLLSDVVEELRFLRSRLQGATGGLNSLSREILQLRELATNQVRPLSHRLFESVERSYAKVNWRHLLAKGAESGAPATFVAFLNLVNLPRTADAVGLQQGFARSLLTSLLLYTLITLLNRANRFSVGAPIVASAATVVLSCSISFGLTAYFLPLSGPGQFFLAVTLTLWLTQSAMVYLVLKSLFEAKATVESELDALRTAEVRSSAIEVQRRRTELGLLLHGQVQSRLMSLSLRTKFGEALQREVVLAELDAIMMLIAAKTEQSDDLSGKFELLVSRWQGFLKFELDLHPDVSLADKRLLDLIEEAVLNAYRHGFAQRVKLVLSRKDNRVVFELFDDGLGPRGGEAGLGSRLFSELCETWELAADPEGGSMFSAKLKD